jgi:hypothetical protein
MENTETVTVTNKGTHYGIVVQHDQSGSAYGIDISNEVYKQLREHFVGSANGSPVADTSNAMLKQAREK